MSRKETQVQHNAAAGAAKGIRVLYGSALLFFNAGGGKQENGSACHACLFLPETSCERMNDLLDRALVQTTLSNRMGFFES